MATKYYAVKIGKTPGIYNTWDDCREQVEGFPGATYKSFKTVDEAVEYMGWKKVETHDKSFVDKCHQGSVEDGTAYVDGSYNVATGEFSYGVVIFHEGKEYRFNKKFDDEELATMRNVAGEIKGAEAAMDFAAKNGMSKLTIYHDYEGIAKWPLRQWKANKEGTIAYQQFYDSISSKVDISFVKVKGHSGDKYNDIADELAKEALGI